MVNSPFSVRLDTKLKKRLEAEAARSSRSAGFVLQKAVEEYLDGKEYFHEEMKKAVKEAEKGAFISEAAMDKWFMSLGTKNELPPPEPDVFLKKPQRKVRA
jgi:predicted transcriptional regulator